jgi:hypothetical protein
MARATCTKCGKRVASYIHTSRDSQGHGTKPKPVCDNCPGGIKAPQAA